MTAPDVTVQTVDELLAAKYFVTLTADDWAWGIDGEVWGDSFPDLGAAWLAALDHWRDQQPELCDRCGDQAVCPDCVGA